MAYFSCLADQALLDLFDAFCEYNEDFGAAICKSICDRAGMLEELEEAADIENLERVFSNAIAKLKER